MGRIIAQQVDKFGAPTKFEEGEGDFPPTLSIFEIAVVSTLAEVDNYMDSDCKQEFMETTEYKFIHKISDTRSELVMIMDVLGQQMEVLGDLLQDQEIVRQREDEDTRFRLLGSPWDQVNNARTLITKYINRAKKIDRDAERIEQVIQNKLNLRRTAASINEAREATIVSLSVFGFTIITFIFTPLSFIASFLALDIDWFGSIKQPANATEIDGSGSVRYSGKKVIGIFSEYSISWPK